jgi:hypothetical protein
MLPLRWRGSARPKSAERMRIEALECSAPRRALLPPRWRGSAAPKSA